MNPNSPLTHEPPEPQEPPDTPTGEPVREHAFDGIREYDNPMPFWWTAIFWLTFAFSVPYFFYYTFGVGERVEQAYERDLGEFYEAQAAMLGDISADVPTLVSLSHDPKMRLAGQALFRSNCATCHGSDGGGGTGPNLTDDRYLNVREITDLHRVIRDGVVGKGMPEWGSRFSDPQLVLLAAYVAGLRGAETEAPKAPQGEAIAPWPAVEVEPATEESAAIVGETAQAAIGADRGA